MNMVDLMNFYDARSHTGWLTFRNTVEFQLYRLGQVYITCIVYKKCTGCSQRNI